jgi:threonine/homoserine/homoserine lactone efflux protein
MLLIGYTGFISQRFIRFLAEKERWVHLLMGCILILFGIWLLVKEAPGFYF